MKKLGLFITILLAVSLSLSASGQLFTLGFDSGWSSAFEGPYMGMHTFYHFGANLDSSTSVGLGTAADFDFGLKRFCDGDFVANILVGFGPSVVYDVNKNLTLNAMIGPQFDVQKYRIGDNSVLGIGVGGNIGFTFVPTSERNYRNQLGFTFGISASATLNVETDANPSFFSAKGFFGITTLTPYNPYVAYDVYDEILFDLYDIY